MDDRLSRAMQQLLRYGAFAQLLTSLQTLTTIEEAAELLCRQWKFCANVGDWRFISMIGSEILRINISSGIACVQRTDQVILAPAELIYFAQSASEAVYPATNSISFYNIAAASSPILTENLILPARVGGHTLGVFFFDSDIASIDALDRKFLDLVASLFAARVTDLMHHEAETKELRRQATVDSLTQIPNRRQFDSWLGIKWLQSTRDSKPISLILLDVDFFKQYNDFYGHPQGDACLRDVAHIIQSVLRPGELVARVGGEEFGILLPGVETDAAIMVAERVRGAIASRGLPHAASTVASHVTASLGLSTMTPDTLDLPGGLYSEADAALYAAKRGGRNCVQAIPVSRTAADRRTVR